MPPTWGYPKAISPTIAAAATSAGSLIGRIPRDGERVPSGEQILIIEGVRGHRVDMVRIVRA